MIFKFLQGIPLFQALAASTVDTFNQRTSPITQEKIELIKKQLRGPWNDEKVDQKIIIK